MTAAFFLSQYIDLSFELCMRSNGSWLSQNLSTLNLFTVDTTEQCTDVIAGLSKVQSLSEHFNASNNCLLCRLDTNDLNFIVHVQLTALDTSSSNCATASDREDIFNCH